MGSTNIEHIRKPKNKIGRRRYNLYIRDPHCYYCGRELKWKESTVDHVYSKVESGKRNTPNGKGETVLACSSCNNKRQSLEIKSLPRWHWWLRSQAFPKISRKDLTLKEKFLILWYVNIMGVKNVRV